MLILIKILKAKENLSFIVAITFSNSVVLTNLNLLYGNIIVFEVGG